MTYWNSTWSRLVTDHGHVYRALSSFVRDLASSVDILEVWDVLSSTNRLKVRSIYDLLASKNSVDY